MTPERSREKLFWYSKQFHSPKVKILGAKIISVHSLFYAYAMKATGHCTKLNDCVLSKWEILEYNTAIKSIDFEIKAHLHH